MQSCRTLDTEVRQRINRYEAGLDLAFDEDESGAY
jgi:hypothetical protein